MIRKVNGKILSAYDKNGLVDQNSLIKHIEKQRDLFLAMAQDKSISLNIRLAMHARSDVLHTLIEDILNYRIEPA